MTANAIVWYRRLFDTTRGWAGLMVGVIIGAVAFGASTAGAGPSDLDDPGGRLPSIKEEIIEEELVEEDHLSSPEPVFEAPPTPPGRLTDLP